MLAFTIARRSSALAITCLTSCFAGRMLVLVPHRIQNRIQSCLPEHMSPYLGAFLLGVW